MNVKFYELAVGARFLFRAQQFEKTAMGMAQDGRGWGNIFMGEMDVETDGEPLLLPPEVAARCKPERGHWAAVVEAAGEAKG